MHQIEQLNGTPIDKLTTVQKAVGFGGAGLATAAVLSAVFNKPGLVKVVSGAAMLLGFASLTQAAIGTVKTRNALRPPATDLAPAEASNAAVFAAIALGGATLTASNIALLAAPTRIGKGLAGARRRRRNRR